jgi:proliferating cell nuclear antigen PCNA
MVLNVVFKTTKEFTAILETYLAISVDNANFQFRTDGLYLSCMDSGHISLVNCKLDQTYFATYEVSETYNIGIQLAVLLKVFKSMDKQEKISFSYYNDKDFLEIRITSDTTKRDQIFNLHEMYIDVEEIKPSFEDYNWFGQLTGNQLKTLFKQISIIETSDCLFDMYPEKFSLTVKGDMGSSTITYQNGDNITIKNIDEILEREPTVRDEPLPTEYQQVFSLTMLQHFTKLCTSDQQLFQLIMHPAKPLCLRLLPDQSKHSFVECYLSPKFVEE